MKTGNQKLTLDKPTPYEIRVPGNLNDAWLDWAGGMTITVESEADSFVTALTGTFDQATLHGLLRRLYGLGLPLISVNRVELDLECHKG